MARAAVEQEWMSQVSALTATPVEGFAADAVATATGTAQRLVGLARHLAAAGSLPSDDRDLCQLADLLAGVPIPATVPGDQRIRPLDAFMVTLRDAGSAVYVCRTLLHSSGTCLFPAPDAGGAQCGPILTAAHRVLR